jgi:hypothetical protein
MAGRNQATFAKRQRESDKRAKAQAKSQKRADRRTERTERPEPPVAPDVVAEDAAAQA